MATQSPAPACSFLDLDPLDRLVAGKREFGEYGGVNPSIETSTTFTVLEADTLPAIFSGEKGGCYVYGRAFNPTVRHLGRLLASMEGCEAAYPCSSGMAAISSTLLALCNSGDRIVSSNTVYGGTHALLKTFLPSKAGIHTTFVNITDLAAVKAALAAGGGRAKVLYTETLSNPTLRVADLRALAAAAHAAGAQLVVDNTFTPLIVTPRRFGADVVIHSLTKFVSGASDIIAGAVCGTAAFIASLMDFHAGPCMLLGPTMDPKVAAELALRLPHLAMRMQEHGRRAAAFAARLESLGAAVTYPGLASHAQAPLMAAQANPGYGSGGLLGVDLGSPARANAFMERLQNKHGFGFMAVSLGYADTLMSLSAASTSSELSADDMASSGIGRGYVRMSVGITGTLEERWRQLEEAYRFTAALGADSAPPFRAVRLRRNASGGVQELLSWPSLGSFDGAAVHDGDDDGDEEGVDGALHGGAARVAVATAAAAVQARAVLSALGEAEGVEAALAVAAAVVVAEVGTPPAEEEGVQLEGLSEEDGGGDVSSGGAGGGEATSPAAAVALPVSAFAAVQPRAAPRARSPADASREAARPPLPPPKQQGQQQAGARKTPPPPPPLVLRPSEALGARESAPAPPGGAATPTAGATGSSVAPWRGATSSTPRPYKIRRLGSTEVHYVLQQQHVRVLQAADAAPLARE